MLGVAKVEEIRNRSSGKNILHTFVLLSVFGCNNRQITECFEPTNAFVAWSIWICEPSVSSNDVNPHWQLPPSRFPAFPFSFHTEPHSTRYPRPERHHCSIAWLGARAPDRLAGLLRFFPAQHPNSKRNAYLGRPPSEHRFRFFLANKGVQLI